MRDIKVAFHAQGMNDWTVGFVYLKNLIFALTRTYGERIRKSLIALSRNAQTEAYARSVGADDVIYYGQPVPWTPPWMLNSAAKRAFSVDLSIGSFLKAHGVDAVYGSCLARKAWGVATLSWIGDFQHIYLPELYTDLQRRALDRDILASTRASDRMILISETVARDFRARLPGYVHKIKVIRPICCIAPHVYERDPKEVVSAYHLPEKFIYLPNQFYRHKNHEIAFRAIEILKKKGIRMPLVLTGMPNDYRHPNYFSELWREVSTMNLRDEIIYLGVVPYEDVLSLMRQCVSVLSTSRFEGWGYSAEEARAIGKRVLLPDIPVFREQDPPESLYFHQDGVEELAEKLSIVWRESGPGPDLGLEKKAREGQPDRVRRYAESFMSVVQEVV